MGGHSKVVQRQVRKPMDTDEFDRIGSDGSIPIVLVPRHNYCCYCCLNIPSGVSVLWQRWTANMGLRPPGLIVCWPAWNRVSHVVTRASKTYNAPVQNCPTSDNVMVSVDVSITFQIQDAEKFVYTLGAHRFDELLSAQTDEAIRGLVHEVPSSRVLDLREEFALGMLQGLNKKVNPFGVAILNVKITEVKLPVQLATTLENTTAFLTQMEQQEKAHASEMRVVFDEAARVLTQIQRTNDRRVQELLASQQRALINRDEQLVSAKTEMDVKIVETKTKGAVAKTNAKAEKENAINKGEKERATIVGKAKADFETIRVRMDQELINAEIEAKSYVSKAAAQAEALLAAAKVEEDGQRLLKEMRSYKLAEKRNNVMQAMASKGKIVISGETGETFLQNLIRTPQNQAMSR